MLLFLQLNGVSYKSTIKFTHCFHSNPWKWFKRPNSTTRKKVNVSWVKKLFLHDNQTRGFTIERQQGSLNLNTKKITKCLYAIKFEELTLSKLSIGGLDGLLLMPVDFGTWGLKEDSLCPLWLLLDVLLDDDKEDRAVAKIGELFCSTCGRSMLLLEVVWGSCGGGCWCLLLLP